MPASLARSLPLVAPAAPRLIGIARLAALGESIAEGHEVEYFTLPVKSLLNRCTSPRMPLDRKSTRLNSSHMPVSRMPSSA